MRKCNPRLRQFRKRREVLLPRIAYLTSLGLTCREVAAKLGVSKTTVNFWLQKLPPAADPGGPAETADKIVDIIARRSARRYDSIYVRAIRAWDRSQSEKQIRTVEQTAETKAGGGENKKEKRSTRTETHAGDSSLLTKAIEALKAIDRLKQANTVHQTGDRGADGTTTGLSSLSVEDFKSLSDEQLDALEARVLAKYGKEGRTTQSPPQRPKLEP